MIVAEIILAVLLGTLLVASAWLIFAKAGQPGWAILVPFYREWLLVKIVGKSPLWFVLLMVPCVNMIVTLVIISNLATVFRKGGGFGAGMLFLPFIFYPILAFGDAAYVGQPVPKRPAPARSRSRDDDEEDEDDRPRRNSRRRREEADED
jgi:hypothetical protein